MPEILPIEWKGQRYELPVCYGAERVAELLERWPRGVIELERIYEHASPSTEKARGWIVRRVLAMAGERLPMGGQAVLSRVAIGPVPQAGKLLGPDPTIVRHAFAAHVEGLPIASDSETLVEAHTLLTDFGSPEQLDAGPEKLTRRELRELRELKLNAEAFEANQRAELERVAEAEAAEAREHAERAELERAAEAEANAAAKARELNEGELEQFAALSARYQDQADQIAAPNERAKLAVLVSMDRDAAAAADNAAELTGEELAELDALRVKHSAPSDAPSARDQLRFLREVDNERSAAEAAEAAARAAGPE